MTSFFERGPEFIQNYQRNLNSWVSGIPTDALWGATKSVLASFSVSILITRGNVLAGCKAGTLGCVASVVHTVVLTIAFKLCAALENDFITENWIYAPHVVSLFSLFSSYLYGRKWGTSLFWTLPATALPYMITQHQEITRLSTPLFVIVVC